MERTEKCMSDVVMKSPIVALVAFVSYLLGMINGLVVVLIFFMILDFTTGVMRAWLTRSVNSSFGLNGIFKKTTMLIIVGVSAGVEYSLTFAQMETNSLLTIAVVCFFIVNEAISILENSAQMGVPVPGVLMDALEKLNQNSGKERRVIRKK